MRLAPLFCLLGSLLMLGGCFDRDDHPAKDADPSKPSLQMQKPDESVIPAEPVQPPQPPQQPLTPLEQDN
ncbi:hypothetical protein ACYU03_12745 [Pseudomonas sp. X10]